jgi:hypothetical protein
MKQTAVEWLVHELGLLCTTDYEDEIQEALEMEEEQIVDAFNEGNESDWNTEVGNSGEQYYNFIFKQKEK